MQLVTLHNEMQLMGHAADCTAVEAEVAIPAVAVNGSSLSCWIAISHTFR